MHEFFEKIMSMFVGIHAAVNLYCVIDFTGVSFLCQCHLLWCCLHDQVSQQLEVRAMVAILLRKLITKDDVSLWPQLSPATQAAVKNQLLLCVQREEGKSISKKLCDTVAELAAGILEEGMWPELLPFMFQCVSSDSMRLRESALLMFAQLAQYIGPQLRTYLPTLHNVFQQNLSGNTSSDVRIAALRATTNFVQTLETAQDRERFQDLLPGMLQTLSLALNNHEEATAQEALEMFIEVAGTEPRFLRRQLAEVVGNMLQIAEAAELEEGTRHLAVEFLITLAEARERAPGMMRKLPLFTNRLFAALMKMLLDIEDDPQWYVADTEDEDTGETAEYEVGQECLDRLAISLGGNTVLPVASQILPSFINDGDWKKRHAALITLAQIAEGCAKVCRTSLAYILNFSVHRCVPHVLAMCLLWRFHFFRRVPKVTNLNAGCMQVMIKNLDSVVSMILNSFRDSHSRVRWAAINAIGQLSTDLGPDLQQNYHQQVLPALVNAMDDFQNPRVQVS